MRRRTVLAAVPTVALAGCMDAIKGPDSAEAEALVREAINAERGGAGVAALDSRDELAEAARGHSRDMHERDFYSHQNPDGEQPWDRVACNASENIHRGEIGQMRIPGGDGTYQTRLTEELARYVADGWINSQSHYENMVDASWAAVGVGVFVGGDDFFATAMFC